MAVPFKPFVVISQALLGSPLTITDQSNFATNTDGVTVNNIDDFGVVIFDKNDQQLQVLSLDYPTGSYAITKDLFLRFHLAYIKGATTYEADVTFLSTQFYDVLARKVAGMQGCGCNCKNELCGPAGKALQAKNAAVSAFIAGDDVDAQQKIDDANVLILQAFKALC